MSKLFEEPTAISEWLNQWDSGKTIWTIEMGGLGPGYEQAIQLLFVELVRDLYGQPLPTNESFSKWGNETVKRIDRSCGGFSGAQVGAAKQIAYRFLRDGPAQFKASIPEDRKIQVSNYWPHIEDLDAKYYEAVNIVADVQRQLRARDERIKELERLTGVQALVPMENHDTIEAHGATIARLEDELQQIRDPLGH